MQSLALCFGPQATRGVVIGCTFARNRRCACHMSYCACISGPQGSPLSGCSRQFGAAMSFGPLARFNWASCNRSFLACVDAIGQDASRIVAPLSRRLQADIGIGAEGQQFLSALIPLAKAEMVARVGLEPTTSALLVPRSNQLSYLADS